MRMCFFGVFLCLANAFQKCIGRVSPHSFPPLRSTHFIEEEGGEEQEELMLQQPAEAGLIKKSAGSVNSFSS